MATALLVPITFFMPPVPAVAAIVTASAMAIFAGDIPGALLRIPGTPASAAYTDEAYAMTLKGHAETALGAGLVFSAIGGLFGTARDDPVLAGAGRGRAQVLVVRILLAGGARPGQCGVHRQFERAQGVHGALLLGLLIACIGLENPAGHPRFTFGMDQILSGIELIPLMVGMFAVSELLRYIVNTGPAPMIVTDRIGNIFRACGS
jgi:putative tricarboxylic transport membrane protein